MGVWLCVLWFRCAAMASSDVITQVGIQPEIQEVEIDAMPVDMPVDDFDGQQIISFTQLPGREEIVFHSPHDEIIGEQEIPYEMPVDNEIYDDLQNERKISRKPG